MEMDNDCEYFWNLLLVGVAGVLVENRDCMSVLCRNACGELREFLIFLAFVLLLHLTNR